MATDAAHLKYFAEFIESTAGIVYTSSNQYQLVRRLEEVATQMGVPGIAELYQRVKQGLDPTYRDFILDVATNNETSFFRDTTMYQALETGVFPHLFAATKGRPIRIWSAAASSGQEAYSVVMLLEAMKAKGVAVPEYSILATDISERILKKAKAATYTHLEAQRGLSARQLVQHFDRTADGHWTLKAPIRKPVQFRRMNLLEEWGAMPSFDLVLCRNIMIYFNVANKGRILSRLHKTLAPHGRLILGSSETMLGVPERALFEDERIGAAYVFKPATKA